MVDLYPDIGSLEIRGIEDTEFAMQDIFDLQEIKSAKDIVSVQIEDTWTCEGYPCVSLEVNNVKFSIICVVQDFMADIIYAAKGNIDAKDSLLCYIYTCVEDVDLSGGLNRKGW